MKKCKFEITLKKSVFGKIFYCARDVKGWAFLWKHDDISDPCRDCVLFREGNPTIVEKELSSSEFFEIAGSLIGKDDFNIKPSDLFIVDK